MSKLTLSAEAVSLTSDQNVTIVHVEGALFFGTASKFEQAVLARFHEPCGIVLLEMSKMPMMDSTGEASLASVVNQINRHGGCVWITNLQLQPREVLRKTGLDERIGLEHFFAQTNEALDSAGQVLINRQQVSGISASY